MIAAAIHDVLACCTMLALLTLVVAPAQAAVAEWFVDPTRGHDDNTGSREAPLLRAQTAVDRARKGDVVHLLPEDTIYYEAINLINRSGLTIEGHGVTLSGSDPLPENEGWEDLGEDLFRRTVPPNPLSRYMLIREGRAITMGVHPNANRLTARTPMSASVLPVQQASSM